MSDTSLNLFNSDTELDIIKNIILTNKQLELQDVENLTNILATKHQLIIQHSQDQFQESHNLW